MSCHLLLDSPKLLNMFAYVYMQSKLPFPAYHEEGDIRVGGVKQHLVHMLLHHLLAGHRYLLDIQLLLDAT